MYFFKEARKSLFLVYLFHMIALLTILGIILFDILTPVAPVQIFDVDVRTDSSIEVSDNLEFDSASFRLDVNANIDAVGVTYTTLKLDEIVQNEGQYIDSEINYMAYSFYIRNAGNETLTIDYDMRLTEILFWMENHIRILIIEDDMMYRMYQKEDQPVIEDNTLSDHHIPLSTLFESNRVVFSKKTFDLQPGDVKLFRAIIWLEGQDAHIVDEFQSGSVKAVLKFTANKFHQGLSIQTITYTNSNENI